MRENWQSKIFIALVAAQCAWAQLRGSSGIAVSGLVVDPSSAIIPGAVVSLWSHGQKQSEIATDTHGAFLFENVMRGRYELHVAFSGFKPFSQRIQIADRAPAPVRVSLSLS